jgi:2-polyprenyl-3-methyl-5-hydroxy-6-metoxy-1,4-benzoquinol methylase/uncharacterized protein YbaR (Trm112 family)
LVNQAKVIIQIMRRELLELIACPACERYSLVVASAEERNLLYRVEQMREIEHGMVACSSCAAVYPIVNYVLSFADRLEASVRADGAFWGTYYSQHYDQGFRGFMDTTAEPVPFLTQGVPTSIPFDGEHWAGFYAELAAHRWVSPGGRVVDIGVGAGWSSLFLARQGFAVIAFDPALELMELAKRHAIASGVYLEYVCSDMANFHVRAECVDVVFALHSLHHIPDIEQAFQRIHTMLRVDGCLVVDDHMQDVLTLALIREGLLQEAQASIFPAYRNAQAALILPSTVSENEGIGMGQVLQTTEKYLHVDVVRYRHICFDILGSLAYLKFQQSKEAMAHATALTDLIYKAMRRMLPDTVEYMTFVAQKRAYFPAGPVFSPPPSARDSASIRQLLEYEQELKRLHAVVAAKNVHIQRLERLLARVENGRVMRLLRWATRRSGTE